jgi:hypothetical protein
MKVVVYDVRREGYPDYRERGREHDWTLEKLKSQILKAKKSCKEESFSELSEIKNGYCSILIMDGENAVLDIDLYIESFAPHIAEFLDLRYKRNC